MRISQLSFLFVFNLTIGFSTISNAQNASSTATIDDVAFIENKGQVCDQNHVTNYDVLFYGQSNGFQYSLRQEGISYELFRKGSNATSKGLDDLDNDALSFEIYRVDLKWTHANLDFEVVKQNPSRENLNFYLEHCPSGVLGVKTYEDVTFKNVFDGIDVKWYSNNNVLEYDYIVQPNADYRSIKWTIEGANEYYVNRDGDLVIKTPFGEIHEKAPIAYQGDEQIEIEWDIQKNNIGFTVGGFNANEPLVIDPVVRAWGTFFGGNAEETSYCITLDNYDNLYVGGQTESANQISTSGSHQSIYEGGLSGDGYIAKFNAAGTLLWATYYGGEETDLIRAIDINNQSNSLYVTGHTQSDSAIATQGAHQDTLNNASDAFLVKLDSHGVRVWGTYFGGNRHEHGRSCTVDALGDVIIAGNTTSPSQLATAGSHQTVFGGDSDVYLAKFDDSGNLIWSTYLGGDNYDANTNIVLDVAGNIYATGQTKSSTGIATSGSHQMNLSIIDSYDAYVAKFSKTGQRLWSTYYGGDDYDIGLAISLDSNKNLYVCGETFSASGISTNGSFQSTLAGEKDAFIVKFDSAGNRSWATYYGGVDNEAIADIRVYQNMHFYVVGTTQSLSGLSTPGSFQEVHQGSYDGYIAKFDLTGNRVWGTYYGGTEFDNCAQIMLGSPSYLYITGTTWSSDAIASAGCYQSTPGGLSDAYVAKFQDCEASIALTLNEASILTASPGASYQWLKCDSGLAPIEGATNQSFQATQSGSYAVVVVNELCSDTSECVDVSVVSISEITDNKSLSVYPNPNNGSFTILYPDGDNNSAFVFDIRGVKVEEIFLKPGPNDVQLNLKSGVYFLVVDEYRNVLVITD